MAIIAINMTSFSFNNMAEQALSTATLQSNYMYILDHGGKWELHVHIGDISEISFRGAWMISESKLDPRFAHSAEILPDENWLREIWSFIPQVT